MIDKDLETRAKEATKIAGTALKELQLSVTSADDRARIERVWRGLRLLDEEQADAKGDRDEAMLREVRVREALRHLLEWAGVEHAETCPAHGLGPHDLAAAECDCEAGPLAEEIDDALDEEPPE